MNDNIENILINAEKECAHLFITRQLSPARAFWLPPRAFCVHASALSHKLRVDRAFEGFNGGDEHARREGNGRVCRDQTGCVFFSFFFPPPAIKTTHDQPWEINWGPANKTLIYGLMRLRLNKLKAAAIYFKEVSEWRSSHLKSNLFTAASERGEKYPSDLYFFFTQGAAVDSQTLIT